MPQILNGRGTASKAVDGAGSIPAWGSPLAIDNSIPTRLDMDMSVSFSATWAESLEEEINYVIDGLLADLEDPVGVDIHGPSGAAFDGCETCIRREVMFMTVEATLVAAHEGLVA